MADTVETLKQFAVKAISARVMAEITEAARISVPKVTVGQLIEQMWDHWKQDGQPAVVADTAPQSPRLDDLDTIERAVAAAIKLASSDGVPETFRKRANRRLLAALPSAPKKSETKKSGTKVVLQMPARLEGPAQEA